MIIVLAFTNIFSTIWSFLESGFEYMIRTFKVIYSTIILSASPFRMFGHAIGSFASEPVIAIMTLILGFSVVLTIYRIFRGNI